MTKTAQSSAGYGHGGLGYHHSLDAMPQATQPNPTVPSWLPWAALLGAGTLGYAGVRGVGKLLRRAPKSPKPAWSVETEMLGRVDPKWQRMTENAEGAMAKQQERMLRDEMFAKERAASAASATPGAPQGKYGSVITTLGRIARGT